MIINESGSKPDLEKVYSIMDFLQPANKKQLQLFLGMLNFYRSYISGCAKIVGPLHAISGEKTKFVWESVHMKAFESLKNLLAQATIQTHTRLIAGLSCFVLLNTSSSFWNRFYFTSFRNPPPPSEMKFWYRIGDCYFLWFCLKAYNFDLCSKFQSFDVKFKKFT